MRAACRLPAGGREKDVAKQISTARKVGRVVKSIVKVIVAIVLVALLAVNNFVLPGLYSGFSRMVDSMLGYQQSWDNSGVNADGLDLDYNKADYASVDELKAAAEELDKQIAAEGYVLLQNEGESLPLAEGTTLSFFSESVKNLTSSQSMISQYTGGGKVDNSTFLNTFAAHGLTVNEELLDFYTTAPVPRTRWAQAPSTLATTRTSPSTSARSP